MRSKYLIVRKRHADEDQRNARLISSRVSLHLRGGEKGDLRLYRKKKFQTLPPTPFQSTFNRPSNFSISINYRVPANHFGEARAGVSSLYIAALFTVPSENASESGRLPTGGTMRPGYFHFQTTTRSDERGGGGRNGGVGGRREQGLAHSEGLFSFLRAASLESRINHARNPGLLSHPPSPSRPSPLSRFEPLRADLSLLPPSPSLSPPLPSPPVYGAAADN